MPVDPITGGVLGVPPMSSVAGATMPDPAVLAQILGMARGGGVGVGGSNPNAAPVGSNIPGSPVFSPAQFGLGAGAPGAPGANIPFTMPNITSGMGGPPGITPNATAAATTGPRGQMLPPVGMGGPTEWQTKSGKRMALTQQAIASIGQYVNQNRQEKWNTEAAQAEQGWQKFHDLQQQIDQDKQALQTNPNDKDAQNRLKTDTQNLQTLTQDKNFKKVMDQATKDPTSSYGVGMQRAMLQAKQEAMDQFTMEQKMAQAQAEMARAQAEYARAETNRQAAAYNAMRVAHYGELTPAIQAQIQGRQDVANTEVQGRKDVASITADTMRQRNDFYNQANQARLQYLKDTEGDTQLTKQYQAEAASLKTQGDQLQKQLATLNTAMAKIPAYQKLNPWYKHDKTLQKQIDDTQTKFNAISDRQGNLTKQYNDAMAARQASRQQQLSQPTAPPASVNMPPDTGLGSSSNVVIIDPESEPLAQPTGDQSQAPAPQQ